MERRERVLDFEETIRSAFESLASGLWTALPGVFQAFTNNGNTCEVQCPINGRKRQPNGTYKWVQLPKFIDVPVQWAGGGGATWTFPLSAGVDEGLIVFSSRCIDQWWYSGYAKPSGLLDVNGNPFNPLNNPPEFRMHNISDGFFIPGVRSKPRAFPSVNTTTARLRTDDNSCYLDFDPVNKKCNLVFPGGITLNGVTIDSGANIANAATLATTGNITGGATIAAQTAVTVGGTTLTVP